MSTNENDSGDSVLNNVDPVNVVETPAPPPSTQEPIVLQSTTSSSDFKEDEDLKEVFEKNDCTEVKDDNPDHAVESSHGDGDKKSADTTLKFNNGVRYVVKSKAKYVGISPGVWLKMKEEPIRPEAVVPRVQYADRVLRALNPNNIVARENGSFSYAFAALKSQRGESEDPLVDKH